MQRVWITSFSTWETETEMGTLVILIAKSLFIIHIKHKSNSWLIVTDVTEKASIEISSPSNRVSRVRKIYNHNYHLMWVYRLVHLANSSIVTVQHKPFLFSNNISIYSGKPIIMTFKAFLPSKNDLWLVSRWKEKRKGVVEFHSFFHLSVILLIILLLVPFHQTYSLQQNNWWFQEFRYSSIP